MQPIYFLLPAMLAALSFTYAIHASARPLSGPIQARKIEPEKPRQTQGRTKSFSNVKDDF
ncbi:MAG: hypothetical protein ACREQR_05810 [Candidatus Binataceae bacterium]